MTEIITGSRPRGRTRRPRTGLEGRVCASERCDTILSRYNRADFCNGHKPTTYPRIRGVLAEEN